MIEPKTGTVGLFSRLGKVGSIQAWNPWDSRKSVAHAKWWVAKVASISYGNTEAANPEHLFQKIVERGHLSCLEFVPALPNGPGALPENSLRHQQSLLRGDMTPMWGDILPEVGDECKPASAFLITCPLYTRSQWMRHRAFSYLEMSRRYTKGSKVAWEFYGEIKEDQVWGNGPDTRWMQEPMGVLDYGRFWSDCEAEYQRRLDAGWPNEIARGCMPQETMTTFWVAGFDRDWREFVKLRSDAHAQPEIQVFSNWIRDYLDSKERQ